MCLYTGDLKALASQTTSLWCNTLGWNGWSCILSADRSTHPAYGLMVLNRLSSENFVQHITPDLPIHIQPPFVLFSRQSSSEFPLFGWNVLGNMYWNALGFLISVCPLLKLQPDKYFYNCFYFLFPSVFFCVVFNFLVSISSRVVCGVNSDHHKYVQEGRGLHHSCNIWPCCVSASLSAFLCQYSNIFLTYPPLLALVLAWHPNLICWCGSKAAD